MKPSPDANAISITPRRSGNRFTYVTELRMVIYYAYRVEPFQLSGDLPNGVYDIETVASGSPDEEQIRLMFQTFLEDRFKLKLHSESKMMRSYELVVAKGGPKLKAAEPNEPKNGVRAPEGVIANVTRAGRRMEGRNASIAQLAGFLARNLKSPVIDRTGITGKFDFDFAFSNENPDDTAAASSDTAHAPPLTLALQEHLGLRLESGKAPTNILVIDHVEQPSEN